MREIGRPGLVDQAPRHSRVEAVQVVDDLVHGRTVFQNTELDDLIIQRSDGNPTYNFCVVVDDTHMEVTHVIRGDDHLNNTPKQIPLFAAFEKIIIGGMVSDSVATLGTLNIIAGELDR